MLTEVLITARRDSVEVFVLNHTTFSLFLFPLSAMMDLLQTLLPSFSCFCGVMIGHRPYLPRQAGEMSQMRYASK